MPIIVSITAADVPRDTLVTMLSRSRRGRGKASMLTKTPAADGQFYAVIDHPDTALTFQAALTELVIGHSEVTEEAPRIQPAATKDTSRQRAWTGDAKVDAAISAWLASTFAPTLGVNVRTFR